MTQQELKDLITGALGPIVDVAARLTDAHPRIINEYLAIRAKLNAAEITQQEFDAYAARIRSRMTLTERLAFEIQLAREDGFDVPAKPAGDHVAITFRPDTDWAALVES